MTDKKNSLEDYNGKVAQLFFSLIEENRLYFKVLAWLLEAEEELATLTDKQRTELSAVRSQFNDFEQFMASLTDSQDTVGKVLHRLVFMEHF